MAADYQLTVESLEALLELLPKLVDDRAFVTLYIKRIAPSASVNLQTDDDAREDFLQRVYSFAQRLAPAMNDIKVWALYNLLSFQSSKRGVHDYDLFVEYVQLPRQSPHLLPSVIVAARSSKAAIADLNRPPVHMPNLLPAVASDVELVEEFLGTFFRAAKVTSTAPFDHYLEKAYLDALFARTKLMACTSEEDSGRYSAGLPSHAALEALRTQVMIKFTPNNKTYFGPDELVVLNVAIKNVPKLTIKVFELVPFNYYREHKREIPLDIDLDGIIPNLLSNIEYPFSPIHRHEESLELRQLSRPGVFVVELVGAGLSSRALVRKGQLFLQHESSVAGHLCRVVDAKNNVRPEGVIWAGGRRYKAREQGVIVLPFGASLPTAVTLMAPGFATSLAQLPVTR